MISRFLTYAAGPFLIAYLFLLLGTSYFSQENLRQASNNALLFNLEKRASALSYFHSERKNDLKSLSKDHSLTAYFSNRALGMSMEYGLRASLLSMQETFQVIVSTRKLNHAPIYLRLLFTENNGNILVDAGESKGQHVHWLNKTLLDNQETASFVIQDEEHSHSVVTFPYFYKGKKMGSIIAEINRDEVMRYLIRPKASENTQYAVLLADPKFILNHENLEQQHFEQNKLLLGNLSELPIDTLESFLTIPVPGTPFILAARDHHTSTIGSFITSRWYLLSLIILTLLVLYSFMIRSHSRTQALLLQTRVEEADRQRTLLNEKNALLEEEIQKRLTSEANLRTLIETIPDLVWLKDPDGVYLSCNHKFERLYGASENDIVGKTDYDFVDEQLADFFRRHDKAAMDAGISLINEEKVTYANDGHEESLETIKTPLLDNEGKLIGVLGIARDITARKRAEEECHYFSIHDPLTGLYNRRVLEERINAEIDRADRYERNLSIFMVDFDHFKNINDTFGHQNGDIALCHLAKLLESSIRKIDYVARYGGEEFVVILPETPLLKGKELAERLCEKIAESNIPIPGEKQIRITASIGVACFPEHGKSWEKLLDAADSAMYIAKQCGRNQVKMS